MKFQYSSRYQIFLESGKFHPMFPDRMQVVAAPRDGAFTFQLIRSPPLPCSQECGKGVVLRYDTYIITFLW